MLRFNDIADRILEYHPGVDLELLQRAYVFAAKVHEGQERLSGEPYLVHPLEVAGILVEMRLDQQTVAVGLLHDTIEDTLVDRDELAKHFGEEVAFLVEGLTKIAKIEFTSDREAQAENFRKMLIAMSKDIRILLIKLADRLHNMRTLGFMSEDSRRRIAQETQEIYVPLAHRLGIHWLKQELEDLAFRQLQPAVVEDLESRLSGLRQEREAYIEEVISILSTKLADASLNAEIKGRVKDLASIHAKMESQGIDLDQVYDVIAFRIILDSASDGAYQALGILHNTWRPVPGRFKDYVALPKPNGYRSLHTAVIGPYGERMEIQIRTREMDRNAELGIAAHWKYKEGRGSVPQDDDNKFAWLRSLLEWQRELDDPHEFLDVVKVDLFPDEVFVFTPKGDVIDLPRLATPVDFAYAIHSEVGDHCAGAKVNGKMVPLRHTLHDGDTVEITQSTHQFPRKDWLEFVVTGKARSRIRHSIRLAENERSRELGRDILSRELRRAGLSLARLLEAGELGELANTSLRGGSVEDLFAAVGYGKVSAASLVKKLVGEPQETEGDAESVPQKLRSLFRRQKAPPSRSGIRVSGQPDVMVRFAGCCDPLAGDEVIGFVTRGRGVTVHSVSCRRVFELDPERRIEVDWDVEAEVPRRIKIRVRSKDQPGILAKITRSISTAGINISDARITTDMDRLAVLTFQLWVADVGTLNSVMKEIEKVRGVHSVERVRG
ncbi:MAG: bifunctional (p)ppGpp synthetase/guanosine-3',5'-bis(diphosphate) 3'-pyrophosphohydrolase [Proteobacteria bacterium]|nr:bifunctional (p)ppGpp synthetase/guanosine-3',5'-bis(diphosphate) 3'-pyrophosphohydrolase [Pseudomonadota bacterium]